ncbi:hypothetical protein OG21DRAFT_1514026 [Imleria badia]|nr:hypothetical protein OG21DRAFT_1514026 [Imleria badia]
MTSTFRKLQHSTPPVLGKPGILLVSTFDCETVKCTGLFVHAAFVSSLINYNEGWHRRHKRPTP